jgi:Flp pilus assembly protein TadG
MRNLLFGKKGQGLVEFALVLPILLLIVLGIAEFGRIFGGYVELQSATRDVTRHAAIHTEIDTVGEITPLVNARLTLLEPDKATVAFTKTTSADGKDVWVQVTLNYPMNLMTPFFKPIIGDPFNMTSKMVMRAE